MNLQEQNKEVHPRGNKDKIERYGWKLIDKPGEMQWISKTALQVDKNYQRDANDLKVKALAREWSWLACGALLVAERDNKYFVFEGQHRLEAALRRSDIDELPCMVFRTTGLKEEAKAFLRANKNRKPLNGIDGFNAAITSENPSALLVKRLIESDGRTASNAGSGSTVRCISKMMIHAERNPETLVNVWPTVTRVCAGKPIHERILEGLFYIELNLPDGQSIADKEWIKRILRVGYDGLLNAANRFSAAYSKGGSKVWALGMIEAINKGCRIHMTLKNKIEE